MDAIIKTVDYVALKTLSTVGGGAYGVALPILLWVACAPFFDDQMQFGAVGSVVGFFVIPVAGVIGATIGSAIA